MFSISSDKDCHSNCSSFFLRYPTIYQNNEGIFSLYPFNSSLFLLSLQNRCALFDSLTSLPPFITDFDIPCSYSNSICYCSFLAEIAFIPPLKLGCQFRWIRCTEVSVLRLYRRCGPYYWTGDSVIPHCTWSSAELNNRLTRQAQFRLVDAPGENYRSEKERSFWISGFYPSMTPRTKAPFELPYNVHAVKI